MSITSKIKVNYVLLQKEIKDNFQEAILPENTYSARLLFML